MNLNVLNVIILVLNATDKQEIVQNVRMILLDNFLIINVTAKVNFSLIWLKKLFVKSAYTIVKLVKMINNV